MTRKAGAQIEDDAEVVSADAALPTGGSVDTDTDSAGSDVKARTWRVPATRSGRLLAAAMVAALLAVVGVGAWWQMTRLPEGAVLRYDDTVVTIDELDQRVAALQALYGVEEPDDPATADGFRRDVAKSVALSLILDRAAADRGIVLADKQVSDTLARYIEQGFGPGGRDAFVRALGNVGSSEAAVREEVRRQMAVGLLMRDVVGEVTVSDADLRAAYEERRDTLGTPERRTLRNIVVRSEADARAALEELRAGVPIEEVAARRSLDASTRDRGGLLGELTRAELEPPVADAAFGVPAGQLYGPVQGQHGWNVGRVDAVAPFVPAGFEQVADQLRRALELERTLDIWRGWLAEQIREADVEYADDYRPADPEAPPAPGPAGVDPGTVPR